MPERHAEAAPVGRRALGAEHELPLPRPRLHGGAELDAQRLTERKMSVRQANRSALVFAYPCYDGPRENTY